MSPLNCLFLIQGEGRGHMTQALALRRALDAAGHRVCSVLVGRNPRRRVPAFFLDGIDAPVDFLESPGFVCDADSRAVRPVRTMLRAIVRARRYAKSLARIDAHLQRHRPDVVVNFFEPLAGLYRVFFRPSVPVVSIAHQYMFLHPAYPFPDGFAAQRLLLRAFTRLTALGADRLLALSLYDADDLPERHLTVMPPLLRDAVFDLPTDTREPFYLVYVLNHGYAGEIIRWHRRHPDVVLHCFWDHPSTEAVEPFDGTLTFHRLDDVAFLDHMARCRGLATTAGFESIAEAMYLGKPVLAVPVAGHFEQHCNALDAASAGAGVSAEHFDLDRMTDLDGLGRPAERFRAWLSDAPACFVRAIEAAARRPRRSAGAVAEIV